jgi:hypothetical protein
MGQGIACSPLDGGRTLSSAHGAPTIRRRAATSRPRRPASAVAIDIEALVGLLCRSGVEFIVVGGAPGTAHGAARLTYDLEVVYRRSDDDMLRMENALTAHRPYLRGAPEGLLLVWDTAPIRRGLNFTLNDRSRRRRFPGRDRGWRALRRRPAASHHCRHLRFRMPSTRSVKAHRAGRPKDLEAIAELEQLLAETEGG